MTTTPATPPEASPPAGQSKPAEPQAELAALSHCNICGGYKRVHEAVFNSGSKPAEAEAVQGRALTWPVPLELSEIDKLRYEHMGNDVRTPPAARFARAIESLAISACAKAWGITATEPAGGSPIIKIEYIWGRMEDPATWRTGSHAEWQAGTGRPYP